MRPVRSDSLHLETASLPSNSSIAHDRASMSPSFSLASTPAVNPEPAYIAAAAASQIVTSEYQSQHQDWYEDEGTAHPNGIALVAPASLALVNAFLDRILFNFLASARSTTLAALRPAIAEVLKPRLAKDAIAGADEELQEFLGGDEDDEYAAYLDEPESASEWDVDLVWKRTRLRCMVYTRLGDMEEEDEEHYIETEHLEDMAASRRFATDDGIVSPPVAIFLTSILEFLGEHALVIASEAAYRRMDGPPRSETRRPSIPPRLVVEETDMEKVALDSRLGRLWRSWRKLLRSPRTSISRVLSRESFGQRGIKGRSSNSTSRKSSFGTVDGGACHAGSDQTPSVAEVLTAPEPTLIPLPVTEHDIAEIEVPGYRFNAVAIHAGARATNGSHPRPFSLFIPSEPNDEPMTPGGSSELETPTLSKPAIPLHMRHAAPKRLHRAQSLPALRTAFLMARAEDEADLVTPTQPRASPEAAVESQSVSGEESASVEDAPPHAQDIPAMHQVAASTINISADATAENNEEAVATSSRTSFSETAFKPDAKAKAIDPSLLPATKLVKATRPPELTSISALKGSVLNAISQHAARELQAPLGASMGDEAGKGMRSDSGDIREGKASTVLPKETFQESTKDSQTNGAIKESVVAVDPLRIAPRRRHGAPLDVQTAGTGEVSPMGLAPIVSGEVSPIEPSDDEEPGVDRRARFRSQLGTQEDGVDDMVIIGYQAPEVLGNLEAANPDYSTAKSSPRSVNGRQRGVDGPTEEDFAKDEKREGIVVLDDSALSESIRSSSASTLSGKDLQVDGTILSKRFGTPSSDNGAPPLLAPLQEMMEAAHDSSDEASTVSAGYPEPPINHSPTKNRSSSGNGSDLRRQLPTVNTRPNVERASVQRISASPGTPHSRSSEGSNRELRSTQAVSPALSPVSTRVKGRASSNAAETVRETMASRASSNASKSTVEDGLRPSAGQISDKQRSFERLINSDETIQYTLTPQSVRQIEGSDSPRLNQYVPPSKTTHVTNLIRNGRSSTDQNRPTAGRSPVSPVHPVNGLRSNPVDPTPLPSGSQGGAGDVPTAGSTFLIHSGTVLRKGPQPVARSARVENETTRDMADFIRSTGPEENKSLPKLPDSRSSSGSRPASAIRNSIASSPRALGKTAKGFYPIVSHSPSNSKGSHRRASRLQAREPTVQRDDESSDLIDFIRQGPPLDRSDGSHRISRAVAPFRSTMDSDEIAALGHGKPRDAVSLVSTHDSLVSRSVHSSTGSRTGLLESTARHNAQTGHPSESEKKRDRFDEAVGPVRRQRRVQDPYALDSDDDSDDSDDDDSTHTSRPPAEETLLDFLNSTPPPDAHHGPPPLTIAKSNGSTAQRRNSASAKSRAVRSASGGGSALKASTSKPLPQVVTPPTSRNRSGQAVLAPPRERSPHLVKKTGGGGGGMFEPTQQPPTQIPRSIGRSRVTKMAQARDEGGQAGDSMRDLADFLKNSGPPDMGRSFEGGASGSVGAGARVVAGGGKEEGGFARIFSRRKKSGVMG